MPDAGDDCDALNGIVAYRVGDTIGGGLRVARVDWDADAPAIDCDELPAQLPLGVRETARLDADTRIAEGLVVLLTVRPGGRVADDGDGAVACPWDWVMVGVANDA